MNNIDNLKLEIEKRLHRVKITLDHIKVKCPFANKCNNAENSYRCNQYYEKCAIYLRSLH